MKTAVVYEIKVNGVRRYIGITNNFIRRQKEHIRDIKKGKSKYLYQKINETPPELLKLEFRQLSEELPVLEIKRLEAHYILQDYFTNKELWQWAPFSFKYF